MKRKIVSMLLALTLVVSGVPVEAVNATEPLETATEEAAEGEVAETTESVTGWTDNGFDEVTGIATVHNNVKQEYSEVSDFADFNVSPDGKAIGSDGVVYEDVVYLSADTVKSLEQDVKAAYFQVCDEIAIMKEQAEDVQDFVIAVDGEGNLHYSYFVPIERLLKEKESFAEKALGDKDEVEVSTESETKSEDETETVETIEENSEVEKELTTEEESVTKESTTEEAITEEESVTKESTTEEAITEEESATEESTIEEDTATEEASTEEESATEESTIEEDTATEEVSTEEESVTEESTMEEETSTEEVEDYELSAENMDLLNYGQEEEFEVVDAVKVSPVIDFGYGSGDIGFAKNNSTLVSKTYFRDQLDQLIEQPMYDAAVKTLINGKNSFSYKGSNRLWENYNGNPDNPRLVSFYVCQAISAVIMQYPYQTDWIDLSEDGGLSTVASYYVGSTEWDYKFTIGKSKFYTSSLVKQANAQVSELANAAQEYAIKNYPNSPVYGVVKYFDKWICENNYYNWIGVTGGLATDSKEAKEAYFYCHSSYGILLKGYGVCESYALAMTRLLDAVGITNMYATGDTPGGGHAWNYIQMPDGKWYLHDSTWNDPDDNNKPSTEEYLLCADDGLHRPVGNRYIIGTGAFRFVDVSTSKYAPITEQIILSKTEINLLPKKTETLTYTSTNNYVEKNTNIPKTWSSSNEKVAKVDKEGKITTVAPGSAIITFKAAGMTASCEVNVHQVSAVTFAENNKTSLSKTEGLGKDSKHVEVIINVKQKNADAKYSVEELIKTGIYGEVKTNSSNSSVADISSKSVVGDEIILDIEVKKQGSAKFTVELEGKKVTYSLSVKQEINESMFDISAITELQNSTNYYTGKAYTIAKGKKVTAKDSSVKFKVSYRNNKNASTDTTKATVVIAGTGNYGGELTYDFTILPLEIDTTKVDMSRFKLTKTSNVYNGGNNPAKTSAIKYVDGKTKFTLKAGIDYDIEYTDASHNVITAPVNVGTYSSLRIVGKNNFKGSIDIDRSITYEIKKNLFSKTKPTITITKSEPTKPVVTVKIGKNVLPETDYVVTYHSDKKCESNPVESFGSKKTYYAKFTAQGNNLESNKSIIKSFKTK